MRPAVILAGGLGTRLRGVVPDTPKPLAAVGGRPFLLWLLAWLDLYGYRNVVLSTGYRASQISEAIGDSFGSMKISYITEDDPLGTGGAVLKVIERTGFESFLLLNGDTIVTANPCELERFHDQRLAAISLTAVQSPIPNRYGTISISASGRVSNFLSKGSGASGYINAGMYVVNSEAIVANAPGGKFSLEADLMEAQLETLKIFAHTADDARFIDIGVPEDYLRAQKLVPSFFAA